jgi:hypothetical protein
VRLCAAAESLLESLNARLDPTDEGDYRRALDAARAALTEEEFTAAWCEGRAMTREQLLAYALEGTGAAAPAS